MAYGLYLKDSEVRISDLGDADLQLFIDLMEEEDSQDRDYFINLPMLDVLQERGLTPDVHAALLHALGPHDGIDVEWREEA